MTRVPDLVAITPGDGRDLGPWLEALGRSGLPAVLVREPQLAASSAHELVRIAQRWVPTVWVHARTPGALGCGLPLHLTADGEPPGADRVWGRSCHDVAEVDAAFAAGARWTFLSPVWAPTSKPVDRRPPLGPDALLAAARGRPVLALGGVTAERYHRLRAAGVGAVVLGDLFGAADPDEASARLCRYLA